MKKNNFVKLAIGLLLATFVITACHKEETLNSEADILAINLPQEILKRDAIVENDRITCYIHAGVDITHIAPTFTLSEGAKITPQSGTVQNFSTPVTYVVSSEDGKYTKQYTITFLYGELATKYHFDHFEWGPDETTKRYHTIYEMNGEAQGIVWASGNSGFSITAGDKPASEYPTFMADNGLIKHAAKLTTCSTGPMGIAFGTPIAAGNLYLGTFELNISNPLQSTKMGIPFSHKPISLKGHYKYKSGDEYIEHTKKNGEISKKGHILDRLDSCAIYAVFYEVTDHLQHLDGTNILTHPNIVSVAQLQNTNEQATWTAFDIPFILKEGKQIDEQKLKDGKYNLALVFSSSKEGHLYNGALQSTLFIDEVEIISE